jgi:hypothetical protein
MNRGTRSALGRCQVCGVRCDAWFCLSCSVRSDYWGARQNDDRRSATATSISRVHQRLLGDHVEHEHVTSRRKYRGRVVSQAPQFTVEELRRWSDLLGEVDPEFRAHSEKTRRQNAIATRWFAARKYRLFCEAWSHLGLQAIEDLLAGVTRTPKKQQRKQAVPSFDYFTSPTEAA